jgi:hypothetical protein
MIYGTTNIKYVDGVIRQKILGCNIHHLIEILYMFLQTDYIVISGRIRPAVRLFITPTQPGMSWGYFGSQVMPELEEMKSLTGSQGVVLVSGLLGLSPFWGSQAEHKKKNKKLSRKTTSGIVTGTRWYTEAGSRINLWP